MKIKQMIQAAHTKLTVRRWTAFLLCAAMVGSVISPTLSARAVGSENTYCEHHTEHTKECGYVEAVEGQACGHIHDEQCGYAENSAPCTHKHNEDCGYVEAVEGQPCRFVCKICGESEKVAGEEAEQVVAMSDDEPAAANNEPVALNDEPEDGLVAYFKFDESSARLHDYSGKGVGATLYKKDNTGSGGSDKWSTIDSESGEWDSCFDMQDGRNVLSLDGDAYLALPEGTLDDLTEMTVEMQIKLGSIGTQHWLFFAAPDVTGSGDKSIGVMINNENKLYASRNSANGSKSAEYDSPMNTNSWYTVRAVYKISSTALYIDDEKVAEVSASNTLSSCIGTNHVVWIGHSAWPGDTNFNGYIDEIKIYNRAIYEPINEQGYIIKKGVQDPKNTTVHMFDYWIEGQTMNDYTPPLEQSTFLDNGINRNHLFLFAGADATSLNSDGQAAPWNGKFSDDESIVGRWNIYPRTNDNNGQVAPYPGIVNNVLGDDGYPQLAIDQLMEEKSVQIPEPLQGRVKANDRLLTESLAYLFKPIDDKDNGKAAYPNVTGLFRLDNDGYYYFKSGETFAELNIDESTNPKRSLSKNEITLYREIWDFYYNDSQGRGPLGQFFPFNDGSDLFYLDVTGDLVQANNNIADQCGTDEWLNHYFGMTVETRFQQPTSGLIDGTKAMEFDFAGDDDVWIFIDDVLVGDLGGLHRRVRIDIDFSTGKIKYTGDLDPYAEKGTELTGFNTNLKDVFKKAKEASKTDIDIEWKKVVGESGEEYYLFPDGSNHTLKFFYLERGNNASNCSIRFNLYQPDDIPTEQPPEENEPENVPEEQSSEEETLIYASAKQPPKAEEETRTTGVLASPNTGDSKMVALWLTLLMFSTTGIIAVHRRTRKR